MFWRWLEKLLLRIAPYDRELDRDRRAAEVLRERGLH